MFVHRNRFRAVILLMLVGSMALSPSVGTAETSYHRLKRKLRKVEKDTGTALKRAGQALGNALEGLNFEIELADDPQPNPFFPPNPNIPSAPRSEAGMNRGGSVAAPSSPPASTPAHAKPLVRGRLP